MDIDNTDEKILKNLLVDARLSSRQLAHKIGLSTVTVISRLKKLSKNGLVKGFTVRLDHELLGYEITAIIEVSTTQGKMLDIENKIAEYENVCGVYDITGHADTLIIAKFKDRNSLSNFVKELSQIPHIENTETHIVLNTVKEDFRFI